MDNDMEWTKDKVIALIKLYRERNTLWNQYNEYFRHKSKREAAWKEIAMAMGTTVIEVQRKMGSVLASYRRERRKKELGVDVGPPKWFAFKYLLFLRERKSVRISDLDGNENASDADICEESLEVVKDEIDSDEGSPANTEGENSGSASLVNNHAEDDNLVPPPSKKKKYNEDTNPSVKFDQICSEANHDRLHPVPEANYERPHHVPEANHERPHPVPEANHERPHPVPEANHERQIPRPELCIERPPLFSCPNSVREKDDCDLYGELLARKLRQIDQRSRDVAMNKIDNLLFKMKMDSYAQQDSQPTNH